MSEHNQEIVLFVFGLFLSFVGIAVTLVVGFIGYKFALRWRRVADNFLSDYEREHGLTE